MRFVIEHAECVERVRASLGALRPAQAAATLHRLKGAAHIVGATDAALAAAAAEDDVFHARRPPLDTLQSVLSDAVSGIREQVFVGPPPLVAPCDLDVDGTLAEIAGELRAHDAAALDSVRRLRRAEPSELAPALLAALEQHVARFDFEHARAALDEIVAARRNASAR